MARLSEPSISRFTRVAAGMGVLGLTLFVLLTEGSGGVDTLATLTAAVAAVSAAAACAVCARADAGRAKVAWIVLSASTGLWALAQLVCWLGDIRRGTPSTTPSPIDVVFIASAIGCTLGVLLLAEGPQRRLTKVRALIEGLMIASCVGFVLWGTGLRRVADEETRTISARLAVVPYPILIGILAAASLFVLTRGPVARRGWTMTLVLGVAAMVASDTAFASISSTRVFTGLQVDDIVRVVGFSAVLIGARRSRQPVPAKTTLVAPVPEERLLMAAPSLAALAVLIGTSLYQATGGHLDPSLAWIAIGVLCLSVLLHLVVIFESHALGSDLSVAHDEAVAASRLKSHFLATVSHEIRTPMNAVIGLTGLLLDSDLDAEQRELAVGVAISAEGLLDLINDVLDFSKVEAEKMVLEQIDLDLEDLVGEVGLILAESAHRKGIEFYAYCEPGLTTRRRGDPLRLRQILLNLGSNAIKFTSEGTVVVRAVSAGPDPDHVAFEVIDSGVGIAAESLTRLFEPFSQLDDSTTRKFGGTGLGLAIVRRLVDLQGGSIGVESTVGDGTTFRVTLPLPVGIQPNVEAGLAALVGLRALVVDGNAVNRTVIAYTLHTWGFAVDQASTAEEALELYSWSSTPDHKYALALIENQLDGMDGVQLAKVLRAQAPTTNTVMLLLSSVSNVSRQAAHDAGIQSVLITPVRNSYLLRRILDTLVTPQPVDLIDAGASKGIT